MLLLSCEGARSELSAATQSFAEALKEAGAAAVYGAEEKLDVHTALSIADKFAERRAKANSTLDVIRGIDEEQRRVGGRRMRLKVERRCLPVNLTGARVSGAAPPCANAA